MYIHIYISLSLYIYIYVCIGPHLRLPRGDPPGAAVGPGSPPPRRGGPTNHADETLCLCPIAAATLHKTLHDVLQKHVSHINTCLINKFDMNLAS